MAECAKRMGKRLDDFQSQSFLLAEDSDEDALIFTRAWQQAKIANPVVRVRDGMEVMAYLNQLPPFEDPHPMPAALFLDLKLPVVDGFAVLGEIRRHAKFRELIVVVLSNSSRAADADRVHQLGGNFYLIKPIGLHGTAAMLKGMHEWIQLELIGGEAGDPDQ